MRRALVVLVQVSSRPFDSELLSSDILSAATALTNDERLVFAGLARLLIAADGRFSAAEAEALVEESTELFAARGEAGPYRAAPTAEQAPDPEALWTLLERAATALPNEEAVLTAARAVTRPEAREAIFDALYAIAASDVIDKSEWPIIDWLAESWGLSVR